MIGLFATYSLLLLIGFPFPLFIVVFSITSTYQFLTHSRYIQTPNVLTYLFVTPTTHGIHHSSNFYDQNTNFGGVFTVWDRLFGTYSRKEVTSYGIDGYTSQNFVKIQLDPIIRFFQNKL
jgi:sterol desaturase/sphingolipid hydroxylase (fatty acid hydroxylase superfamily)